MEKVRDKREKERRTRRPARFIISSDGYSLSRRRFGGSRPPIDGGYEADFFTWMNCGVISHGKRLTMCCGCWLKMKREAGKFMRDDRKCKGIIFDMDNTLLQSRIDFAAMKEDICQHLIEQGILTERFPLHEHTTSTMLEYAKQAGMDHTLYLSCLKIAEKHEVRGMEGAGLEKGVPELLESLYGKFVLVVVTNNSRSAALKALEVTGIKSYFDSIIGREQMEALKPSPSGFTYALNQFRTMAADEWISVGDSWMDGQASAGAGIPFISYRTSMEAMRDKGVRPIARIEHILEVKDWIYG